MWSELRSWNRGKNIRSLREAVRKRQLLILTGTGVSIQLAKPIHDQLRNDRYKKVEAYLSWTGLIENGYENEDLKNGFINYPQKDHEKRNKSWTKNKEIFNRKKNSKEEYATEKLLELAQPLQDSLFFSDWIKTIFKDEGLQTVANYSLAAAIDSLRIPVLTTNYDDLLSIALKKEAINYHTNNDLYELLKDEILVSGEKSYVYHIHGHYSSSKSIVFSQKSYNEIIQNLRKTFKQVEKETAVFSVRNLLFIGIGAGGSDPHWQLIFSNINELGLAGNIYWLVHQTELNWINNNLHQNFKDIKNFKKIIEKIKLISFQEYEHLPLLLLSLRDWSIPNSEGALRLYTENPIIPDKIELNNELFSDSLDCKKTMLLRVSGPGGAGKTTFASKMLNLKFSKDLHSYCYWSFNSQGYKPSNKFHEIPQASSKLFFRESLLRLGLDDRAMFIWITLFLSTRKEINISTQLQLVDAYKSIVARWKNQNEWTHNNKRNKLDTIFKEFFEKQYGERAELLHFLLVQGPFVLVLDGLEPLQAGGSIANENHPTAEVIDKEIQLFLSMAVDKAFLKDDSGSIDLSKLLIVITSRYKPTFSASENNHLIKDLVVWGVELPGNITESRINTSDDAKEKAMNFAYQRKLFIIIDEKKYVSPLMIDILKKLLNFEQHLENNNIDKLIENITSNTKIKTNRYESLHSHVELVTRLFLELPGTSGTLKKCQYLMKLLGHFDYAVTKHQLLLLLKLRDIEDKLDFNPSAAEGLLTVYYGEGGEIKACDLHPLVRNTVSEWLKLADYCLYTKTQKTIAENIVVEKKPDDVDITHDNLLLAFRQAKHYIQAECYDNAQEVFELMIQGVDFVAGNRFGMHAEILSLLYHFYPNGWNDGIYNNSSEVKDEWAMKVNKAAANSLMSTGKPRIALELEEKTTAFYKNRLRKHSNGFSFESTIMYRKFVEGFLDSIVRQIDTATYSGQFDRAVQVGEEALENISYFQEILLPIKFPDSDEILPMNYHFWQEVVNGKCGYTYSWKAMLSKRPDDYVRKSENYFQEADKYFIEYLQWREALNTQYRNIKIRDYYTLPHIIWRERYDSLKLRIMNWEKKDENHRFSKQIDSRLKQFEGEGENKTRIAYHTLNLVNKSVYEFCSAMSKNRGIEDGRTKSILLEFKENINKARKEAVVAKKINFELYALTSALWHLTKYTLSGYLNKENKAVIESFDDFLNSCREILKTNEYNCYELLCDHLEHRFNAIS
ncbi:SIR2-like domain-containing protein [Nitrosomonas aestuarii]|uniref:SIR2-like domain-containing protein n=1 Tax=Nitrosomonas aestuarii TaxID=52441 RepID=A0A1I4FX49_9PROT|nr:SIR2 family protein [Nitrosomonas aestuarii]SFL21800.1 SIR2-like domain-containing protein [Nitrosomonas aestuarii]